MHFIGIIANQNDFEFIKNEIRKKLDNSKIEVFNINCENVKFIKNIKFELVIINLNLINLDNKILNKILQNTNYIMINSDIENNIGEFEKINAHIITYGLNQKSTLTLSSIEDNEILLCLQRSLKTLENQVIEPSEIYVKKASKNVYNNFIMFGILLIFKGKI